MRGKILIFLVLSLAGLSECTTNAVSDIGSDFFNNQPFDISYIDSVNLKVSTVLMDSMRSSDATRLLVGYHVDEKLGPVTAQGIFQVGVSRAVTLDENTTDYLSLRLFLHRDGYSYYDTTGQQTISVHRLTKDLKLINGSLYNSSKFVIDRNAPALGSLTFSPRPKKTDSLEIFLSDDLGRELMSMAKAGDARLATYSDFVKFFKGLALLPDTLNSANMIGFKIGIKEPTLRPEMRLYYRDRSTVPSTDKHISFTMGTSGGTNIYFNKIRANRQATKLNSLKLGQPVSSAATDNESYLQSGVGLSIRIEMPYLRNLLLENANFQCSAAILELVPISGSYTRDPLPASVALYPVDKFNQYLTNRPFTAGLFKDLELGRNTSYRADITGFVNAQIQNSTFNNNALLVLLDDLPYRSSVNRLYLGDKKNPNNMKIKLYFVTLSNQ
jgi:hypothetical protein